MKTKRISRLRFALTSPDSRGIIAAFAGIFIVLLSLCLLWGGPSANPITALLVGSMALLTWGIRQGMTGYDGRLQALIAAEATKWVYLGATPDEIRERKQLVDKFGAASVLTQAGMDVPTDLTFGSTNIDGIPMLDDCVDVHGKPYGMTDSDDFGTMGIDVGTGMPLDATSSYQSPHGMD